MKVYKCMEFTSTMTCISVYYLFDDIKHVEKIKRLFFDYLHENIDYDKIEQYIYNNNIMLFDTEINETEKSILKNTNYNVLTNNDGLSFLVDIVYTYKNRF